MFLVAAGEIIGHQKWPRNGHKVEADGNVVVTVDGRIFERAVHALHPDHTVQGMFGAWSGGGQCHVGDNSDQTEVGSILVARMISKLNPIVSQNSVWIVRERQLEDV